jgi:transposase
MGYHMTHPAYLPKDYETFIGLDVDKSSFAFTISNDSQTVKSKKMPSNPEHLYNYIQKHFDHKKVICAYEAGPTGFHLYDYLTEKDILCLVTSPASIPKPSNQKVKNNRIDSTLITKHLMSGDLKPIRVPQGPYRELRDLVKIRNQYATDRKTAKQRIKAYLLYKNLYPALKDPDSNWSSKYISDLKQIECSFAERQRLSMLIEDLEYARNKLLSVQRTLRSFCRENDEITQYIQYLRSIPGIGPVIATTLLGKIGNPMNLKDQRELAAFVGLTPREKSTGDAVNRGSITQMGDKTLRFLLVEAAWTAIRKDTQLSQFYHRIRRKNNPKIATKIAITAVARKLTQIIYRVLKDKREYIQY